MNFTNPAKILHHPGAMSQWLETGDTTGPISVKVDLTNVCNHNCPGCIDYDLIATDNNRLPLDLFEKLLPDLKKIGVLAITFTGGGEPTIHPQFAEIVQRTKSFGFGIGLITNGSYFHKLPMEELLPAFDWIRISMDAFDEISHKQTHGPRGNFKQLVENIRMLVTLKRSLDISVTLGAGYLTHQYPEFDRRVEEFIVVCRDIGLDYAQLRPSFGRLYDYEQSDFLSRLPALKSLSEPGFSVFASEGKYKKIASKSSSSRMYSSCHSQAFKATTITASGDVFICCSLTGTEQGKIGNVKFDTIADIWNSSARRGCLDEIDVTSCPDLCVGDELNEFLEQTLHIRNPEFL